VIIPHINIVYFEQVHPFHYSPIPSPVKGPKKGRGGGSMIQAVEHQPSKHKFLSSTLNTSAVPKLCISEAPIMAHA
jgi:hypothetical protein